MVWRRQFLCPGSHRCRRLGFRSHTHTSRMRMMATALPATSISRMVLARLATCCNYKPTIRRSRNSSTGLQRMEWTRATRCSCSPLTKERATPAACAFIPARTNQSFAWNHGDIQDEIASTWVGYVGQGVDPAGVDSTTWSDHTDVRPTILNLVGLKDDYVHDGRAISEVLESYARPLALKKSASFTALAQVYKQVNAPFGAFAMATLRASTKALASNDAGDATYNSIEGRIKSLTARRDALAAQMIRLLNGAEFKGKSFGDAQAQSLIAQGQALLNQANGLPH